MKKVALFSFATIAIATGVAASAGSEPGSTPATTVTTAGRLGSAAVYAEIAAETSCVELQAMFERAEANGAAARSRRNLDLAEVTTAYMTAADRRMRQIGCYR